MSEEASAPEEAVMEEAAQEAVQEETPQEEPKPDFAKQFAAISKKERVLREREGRVKNLEGRLKDLESSGVRLGDIQKMAKENPAKLLGELGINYDDLTQQVINEGNPTAEQNLKLENERLRGRVEKLESVYENQTKEVERRNIETARTKLIDNVKEFVDNNEDFDLVQHNSAYDLVAEVMQQHYNQTKEIMEYSRAAQVVEQHFEGEAERYFGSKKIRDKWLPKADPETEQKEANSEAPAEATSKSPKTLSNQHAAQQTDNSTGLLSRQQSLERIARMIDGAI